MDVTPFKLDIDELIHEFCDRKSTTLVDMKKIWLSRKLSFIYEGRPKNNEAFVMQSLYGHSIGHMLSKDSISQSLGGFFCLYCLCETQPFQPPFWIYLSLVVPALVKKMLDKNTFLFGFVDINEKAEKTVDIENIKHITENKKLIGDVVEKMAECWNAQKVVFCEQTGINRTGNEGEKQVMLQGELDKCFNEEGQDIDEDIDNELRPLLG
ncbi:hypothetical protein MKX01_025858 [Papaver californicum]|nr:hypothetical protein MKX01_025858 [Papaver californicum]